MPKKTQKAAPKTTPATARARISIDTEALDRVHVLLSESDAIVDVLPELAGHGDVESLKKHSLVTSLYVAMERIEKARDLLFKGTEKGGAA